MMILINNPVQATYIFTLILTFAVLFSIRRKPQGELFPLSLTQSLKGVAILAIVFSHIGYFLVTDHRFLFPLTIMAGVGVSLFLFLSGYGLAVSSLKKEYSVWQFYSRRLLKLFIPLWIILALFFLSDFFILKLTYSWSYIGQAIIGYFSRADLFRDLNSPLWYFTLILFYYLVFPLVFWKKYPWLSAIIIYLISYLIIKQNPNFLSEVMHLYKVHIIAFPLGVLLGGLFYKVQSLKKIGQLKLKPLFRYFLTAILLAIIAYTAYYSGVGKSALMEEGISLITMGAIISLFLIIKVEFKLFYLFGLYSYEIYLLHWPILYRYDLFFKFMPAWLAMVIYLFLFLGLGWALNILSKKIISLYEK